jgi:hypothetical protein
VTTAYRLRTQRADNVPRSVDCDAVPTFSPTASNWPSRGALAAHSARKPTRVLTALGTLPARMRAAAAAGATSAALAAVVQQQQQQHAANQIRGLYRATFDDGSH